MGLRQWHLLPRLQDPKNRRLRHVSTNSACGVRDVDNEEQLNKQDGIVNKIFVEMLDKLGYDIQITYVKKETN